MRTTASGLEGIVNRILNRVASSVVLLVGIATLACAAEVGSERWCKQMDEKAKGDWSANEAVDYAKHCVLR